MGCVGPVGARESWTYFEGGPGVVSPECPVTAAWCVDAEPAGGCTLYLDACQAFSWSCDGTLEHKTVAAIFNAAQQSKAKYAQMCRMATTKVSERGWLKSDGPGTKPRIVHIVPLDKFVGLLDERDVNINLPLKVGHVAALVAACGRVRPPAAPAAPAATPDGAAGPATDASTPAMRTEPRFPPAKHDKRTQSWVLETDPENLPTQRGEARKLSNGTTQYALKAREFLQARRAQFASAPAIP